MNRSDFQADITRDDRGRIVAEVWHKPSGQTVAIQECGSQPAANLFVKTVIDRQLAKAVDTQRQPG